MRKLLTPYTDGLKHCAISMLFGCMLEEKRDGRQVFEVRRPIDSEQTVVFIRWPVGELIKYLNTGLNDLTADLGLQMMQQLRPSVLSDSYGVDVLVFKSDALGTWFWEQIQDYERFRDGIAAEAWADFEVSRGYYRAEMEKFQEAVGIKRLELDFQDDYARLTINDGGLTQLLLEKCDIPLPRRYWYDDDGLAKLKDFLFAIGPIVTLYGMLGGPQCK